MALTGLTCRYDPSNEVHRCDVLKLMRQQVEAHNGYDVIGRPEMDEEATNAYLHWFEDEVMMAQGRHAFVYVEDDHVLGLVVLKISGEMPYSVPIGRVEEVVVDNKNWRRGIGRLLMDEAETFSRCNGCYSITLDCAAGNVAGHALYKDCGMHEAKTVFAKEL